MTDLFNKVREYIKSSANNEAQMLHFDRTVHWVKELRPDADEALLIAAIAHDVERCFRHPTKDLENNNKRFTDVEHLIQHQEEGARIMGEFLEKQGADTKLIERVKHLITKHEIGGDEDQNLLKDCDSLSFVENNTQIFIPRLEKLGYDKIKEKMDWMYNRISDSHAKELATPFYEKMIAELNKAAHKTAPLDFSRARLQRK
jgi:hypothetical protein